MARMRLQYTGDDGRAVDFHVTNTSITRVSISHPDDPNTYMTIEGWMVPLLLAALIEAKFSIERE